MRLRKRMENVAAFSQDTVQDKAQRIEKLSDSLEYAKKLVDDLNQYNLAIENEEREEDSNYEKQWLESYNDVVNNLKMLVSKL